MILAVINVAENDSDPELQCYAVYLLGQFKSDLSLEYLINTALKSQNPFIRRTAAEALGKYDNKEARNALINTLKSSDRKLICSSLYSLSYWLTVKDIGIIEPFLIDENPEVRNTTRDVIKNIRENSITREKNNDGSQF